MLARHRQHVVEQGDGSVHPARAAFVNRGVEHPLYSGIVHAACISAWRRLDNAEWHAQTGAMILVRTSGEVQGRPPSIEVAARDATWLAHRYDPGHDAVHFLPVARDVHARATFVTDQYLPKDLVPLIVRRREATAAMPPRAPLHISCSIRRSAARRCWRERLIARGGRWGSRNPSFSTI